jgi:hypothetical protein
VPKASVESFIRCAAGNCQQDASKEQLGVLVSEGKVFAPVCQKCQMLMRLITKTVLVDNSVDKRPVRGSGDNDMVKVGGVLRARRAPRTVKVKVA